MSCLLDPHTNTLLVFRSVRVVCVNVHMIMVNKNLIPCLSILRSVELHGSTLSPLPSLPLLPPTHQLERHLALKGGDCPLAEVDCPFNVYGCSFVVGQLCRNRTG